MEIFVMIAQVFF